MGVSLDADSRDLFSILMNALMKKEFPPHIMEKFGLPEELCQNPKRNYIFTMPDVGSVFDYRFIKEVRASIILFYFSIFLESYRLCRSDIV